MEAMRADATIDLQRTDCSGEWAAAGIHLTSRALLMVLPVVLALAGYYRAQLAAWAIASTSGRCGLLRLPASASRRMPWPMVANRR